MTSPVLVRAYVVCSDEGCDAELEVIGTPEEVEAIVCDCGFGFHVIGWPEPLDSPARGGSRRVRDHSRGRGSRSN